jgi:ribonuclease HI
MFVDDVLILSKADPEEWQILLEVLQHFGAVSGLSINLSKSSVHYWGITDSELLHLKASIPLTFKHLSEGFIYLGFRMKMGRSSPGDWAWLVDIFVKKIGFWCNKWLSLGGRLILVKSVLESLAVYWMMLERIPTKIITTLRSLSFKFLWGGHADLQRIHLCSWQTLSQPRRAGGWGLKNLSTFNVALLASNFWRAVSHNSIWNQLITDKYLDSKPLLHWLRLPTFQLQRASPFWKGLVASSQVILHWLRWRPGKGTDIKIGRDLILGLGERSLLSPPLRLHLQNLGITALNQVRSSTVAFPLPDAWKNCSELSLCDPLASEWTRYTTSLKSAGISLSADPDGLVWAGGDATGVISVKNIYKAILSQHLSANELPWINQLWAWKVPLKLKLFSWLAGKERILTWDALQRRGWEGPGYCCLCKKAAEDLNHLLIRCPFTAEVWHRSLKHFSISFDWCGSSVSNCFARWYTCKSAPPSLAAHICWSLWLERNRVIFEGGRPSLTSVFNKILVSFRWIPTTVKCSPRRDISFDLDAGHTIAFFDGAAQLGGSVCGAGGTFKSHPSRTTNWFINCGAGTNTKAELMGLWATLSLAALWSIDHIHIQGDSRVIIDWISNQSQLHSTHLASWMRKVRDLTLCFTDINFRHVPRSHNCAADALSKRALTEVIGRLSVYHSDRGVESPITSINVFE